MRVAGDSRQAEPAIPETSEISTNVSFFVTRLRTMFETHAYIVKQYVNH